MIARASLIVLALSLASCHTLGLGDKVRPPEYRPAGETRCRVLQSQNNPLVVEWPSTERGALESALKRGPVLVRYTGCEMEVLKSCEIRGRYRYAAFTPKRDRVTIRDEDELYATLPVGAPALQARLKTAGSLEVDMTLVGRFELDGELDTRGAHAGCETATHVVTGVTVGSFTFSAGALLEVGAGVAGVAGARTAGERETLTRDGEAAACASATPQADAPPDRCGAIVRIEVRGIPAGPGHAARAEVPVPSEKPSGRAASAWVLGGIGVIGLGVGAGYGWRALSLSHDSDIYCDGRACRDQKGIDLRNQANDSATISTVSSAVGVVALGAGLLVGLTGSDASPKEPLARKSWSPGIALGPGSVTLRGQW
jgi:hypothetical protein